jgi:hypothetical protein
MSCSRFVLALAWASIDPSILAFEPLWMEVAHLFGLKFGFWHSC